MSDVVVGSFVGYKPHHLAPWINSLRASGYAGAVVVFAYADGPNERESAGYLRRRGVEVQFRPAPRKSLVVDRFADMAAHLEGPGRHYRNVIATDLGDVIFQRDPSPFLATLLQGEKSIVAGSEGILYADHPWNRENLLASFPAAATTLLPLPVYNAGVIAARRTAAVPLFREIHRLSVSSACGNPDQVALNLLLQGPFRSQAVLARMQDGWAAHCGVTAAPAAPGTATRLLEPPPSFEGMVARLTDGTPACILHQYNRLPELGPRIARHYGGAVRENWSARVLRRWHQWLGSPAGPITRSSTA